MNHRENSSGLHSETEESADHSPEGEDMELSYASSSSSGNDDVHTSDHAHEPEGIHPFLYEPLLMTAATAVQMKVKQVK